MPNMSNFAEPSIFEKVVPSHNFSVDNFDNVDVKHNSSIAALTDPLLLGYTTDIDQIVNVLSDPAIAQYQDCLIKKAVAEISADRVDIDHIRIGLKLTEKDFIRLVGEKSDTKPDKKSGILAVRNGLQNNRLTVAPQGLGLVNKRYKKKNKKPFFTEKYRICVDNDPYRYMNIYLAASDNPNNNKELDYNCVLECIPTRLSQEHIALMLSHFKSCVTTKRYRQLIENGLLLRLDTGYVMHGVSQLFVFNQHKKRKAGRCIPTKHAAVETTNMGDEDYKPVIAYDKVLKENKKFMEEVFEHIPAVQQHVIKEVPDYSSWFADQAVSLRLESRDFMSKGAVLLANMEQVESGLEQLSFIRPKALLDLEPSELKALITDKRPEKVKPIRSALIKKHKGRSKKYLFKFNPEHVRQAFKQRLEELKQVIFNPSKSAELPDSINYTAQVIEVRKRLAPYVKAANKNQPSENEIVHANGAAIYVEGCPGAGKTALIVKRVKALVEAGDSQDSIAVLAYTKEAAKQFKQRLRKAKLLSENMYVGTFSAWCKSELIGDQDLKVLSRERAINLIESLLSDYDQFVKYFDATDLAQHILRVRSHAANFDKVDVAKSIAAVAAQLTPFQQEVTDVLDDYQQWKDDNKKVDFDDLLIKARANLKDPSEAKNQAVRFKHVILDEVQDSNVVQWDILKALFREGSNIFCVGDPAQSMYVFRGADSEVLNNFERNFKNGLRFNLTKNYRSTPEIVDLSNHLRRKINRNYRLSVAKRKNGSAPRYRNENTLKSAATWIVTDIRNAATEYPSCMVLCRYKNHKKLVKKVFESADLPDGFIYQVQTYHAAKGSEADNVYVLDPLFSNYRLGTKKEEHCNTYVAFTRAKSRLTIIASNRGAGLYGNPDSKKTQVSIFAELAEEYSNGLVIV